MDMIDELPVSTPKGVGVSLVGGDPEVRHSRQLMLRAERYEVRSYATSAALLADPRSRDYSCIVMNLDPAGGDVFALLRAMRGSGWRGKAVLIEDDVADRAIRDAAARHGDEVLARPVSQRVLLSAIDASVNRGWSGWNAGR
jgi:FixJ family two-component response regulator